MRRWGTTGERSGVVSPLLVPAFVRSAFALDPAQRVDNALHRALVRRLVPEWAEIPFFKPVQVASRGTRARIRCVADAPDRDLIEDLLGDVEGFDPRALNTLWAASVAGASSAAGEATLRLALWRAAFDHHLVEVNRHLPAHAFGAGGGKGGPSGESAALSAGAGRTAAGRGGAGRTAAGSGVGGGQPSAGLAPSTVK